MLKRPKLAALIIGSSLLLQGQSYAEAFAATRRYAECGDFAARELYNWLYKYARCLQSNQTAAHKVQGFCGGLASLNP